MSSIAFHQQLHEDGKYYRKAGLTTKKAYFGNNIMEPMLISGMILGSDHLKPFAKLSMELFDNMKFILLSVIIDEITLGIFQNSPLIYTSLS